MRQSKEEAVSVNVKAAAAAASRSVRSGQFRSHEHTAADYPPLGFAAHPKTPGEHEPVGYTDSDAPGDANSRYTSQEPGADIRSVDPQKPTKWRAVSVSVAVAAAAERGSKALFGRTAVVQRYYSLEEP